MSDERRRPAGFTLLEILVAIVVLGFLMVGLIQGVRLGVRAWDLQARALGERGELDAVDRTLRHLIEHIEPGSQTGQPGMLGHADLLQFTSELPSAAALLTSRADMSLMVDDQRRLVLHWRPHLHEVPFGPLPEETETELLRRVDHVEFAYWRPGGVAGPGGWVPEWADPAPPELVRIRIVFPEGDSRRWPDIVAAPILEQGGG